MTGRVVSTKLKNTATVLVERIAKHSLYNKTFIRSRKYLVDDQIGVKEGDVVEIINCKPISSNKHWKIVKVVGKSLQEIMEEKLKKAAAETITEAVPAGPLRREASKQVMPEEKPASVKASAGKVKVKKGKV